MKASRPALPVLLALLLWSDAVAAQSFVGSRRYNWTSPCTLSVVLVTFKDTVGFHPGSTAPGRAGTPDYVNYHDHDLPHDYMVNAAGALVPGDSSYKMEDFRRLFSGGKRYDYSVNGEAPRRPAPFVGDTVHVANRTQKLPEVFGSLRKYFDVISGGRFELRVRILNKEDRRGYPVWVQLPETKGYYAERFDDDDEYWDDAHAAIRDSVTAWGFPAAYVPPDATADAERRIRHKVLYLHSGPMFHDEQDGTKNSLIHPRADRTTSHIADPATADSLRVGFRYVMGERQGSGSGKRPGDTKTGHHRADRFTGIGQHAHEIGHLLGFRHPEGSWTGTNPYTQQTTDPLAVTPGVTLLTKTTAFNQARTMGWGIMQNDADGPAVEGRHIGQSAYVYAYRSSPAPMNPVFRLRLGWIDATPITGTTLNQRIAPGSYYTITDPRHDTFVLEFRPADTFGRYSGWYRFTEAPGLLIWRESSGRVQLVPADHRSLHNAKERKTDGTVAGATRRVFTSTFVYPWQDRVSDPFGAKLDNGLRATIGSMAYYKVDRNPLPAAVSLQKPELRAPVTAADDHHFRIPKVGSGFYQSERAVRNIRVTRTEATGHADVDVYFDHWSNPLQRGVNERMGPGVIYIGGDVTIGATETLTILDNTEVLFLAPLPLADDDNGRSELIVQGTLTVGAGVTFRSAREPLADGTARTVPERHGIRVETGGTATLNGVTIADGYHHWSGLVTVAGDLTVTDTLAVAAGSEVRFAAGDSTHSGRDPSRTELTVASGGMLTAPGVDFRGAAAAPPWWYGIYVEGRNEDLMVAEGRADLTGATVRDGLRCVGGPGSVTPPTRMTVGPCAPPPEAPGDLTATPDDGQISLSWTAAETHEALPVLGYRVRHYRAEAAPAEMREAKWKGVPGGGSARDTTLAGLDNGTAYLFRVLAENAAGAGGPRAEVTATPLGPPANLRAEAGDGQVTLRWDDPSPKNETIAKWQYCRKPAGAASCEADSWQTEASASARQAVVSDLKHGQAHEFEVRAVNTADQAGPAASAAAVLHEVTFNSTGYVLIEGGEPLAGQPGRDRVKVMVLLTPAPPSAPGVAIPLTVGAGTAEEDDYAEEGDYEVGPPAFNSSRVLTFPRNQTSRSFTLSVKADADTIHETVLLGFGDLPAGVRTGARPSATVTLYDTPNAPLNVRAEPGHETVTLRWDDPEHGSIRGWQYRKRLAGPGNDWEDWSEAGSGATRTEYTVPNLTNGLKYMFKVRAFNTRGYGAASKPSVEATPSGLRATAYNGAVGLAWVDPEVAGLASWQRRHRPVLRDGKWSPFARHDGGAGTHVVRNLTNDQEYRFEVQGLDAAGEALDKETCGWSGGRPCTWQAVATPRATLPDPPPPPCRLSLTGPADTTYAEHGTGWVGVYTPGRSESCDESLALTWTRRGADADAFTVSGDTLYFAAEPDYEQPVDAGGDNAYDLQVWIRAGSDSTHAPVQVRVTNIEEPGRVALSGTLSLSETDTVAAVGTELTASLSDADGVRPEAIAWEWHRWSLTATPPGWQPLDGEEASTYTPSRSVLGARLRVRATYTDGHGPGKSAEDASIERVVDVPDAPGDLRPAAGDASVRLTWEGAVSNGSAISSYQHRRRPDAGGRRRVDVLGDDNGRRRHPGPERPRPDGVEPEQRDRVQLRGAGGQRGGSGGGGRHHGDADGVPGDGGGAGQRVCAGGGAPGDSVIAVFTVTDCGGSAVTANRWEITGADVETRRDTLQIDGSGAGVVQARGARTTRGPPTRTSTAITRCRCGPGWGPRGRRRGRWW